MRRLDSQLARKKKGFRTRNGPERFHPSSFSIKTRVHPADSRTKNFGIEKGEERKKEKGTAVSVVEYRDRNVSGIIAFSRNFQLFDCFNYSMARISWKSNRSYGVCNNLLCLVRVRGNSELIRLSGLAGTVKVAPRSQLLPLRRAADPCVYRMSWKRASRGLRFSFNVFDRSSAKEKNWRGREVVLLGHRTNKYEWADFGKRSGK